MSETKIGLSPEELELVQNAGWILTKNAVIEKTKQLFNALQDKQEQYLTAQFTELKRVILDTSPKISKGENYKGLPYVVLDYPRLFDKENIIAVRCLFWWGHFISVTLHISGKYKKIYERNILRSYGDLKKRGFYYCVNTKEWEHHFEDSNYLSLKDTDYEDFEKVIEEREFLKIAYPIPVDRWNEAQTILYDIFTELIDMLKDQAPSR